MARYAFSIYGDATYGGPQSSVFSAAPVVVTPVDYGSVLLTWRAPGGVWDELRVIRNSLGYPVSVDNGVEVYTTTPDASGTEVREQGLTQDHWVYYTIFVHDTVEDMWVHAGIAKCFVPSDYSGGDRLYELVPETAKSETLQRFLSVIGYAYDLLRNDINSVLDLHDSMAVSYDLVPLLLAQFGIPIEPELEPEQYRRFLRNAAFFYKIKGTEPCVHGVVAAITGWQCTVRAGANLLWTSDYSNFTSGLGGWVALHNATVSWAAATGTDSTALQVAATATGPTTEVHIGERLPIYSGLRYSAAALVRALDAPPQTASLRIDWYDINGVLMSSSTGAAVAVRQTVDTTIRVSDDTPIGAHSADLVLVVNNPTVGHRWQWREVMFNEGVAAPYEPGRDIRIYLAITDTDPVRRAVHLERLGSILPRYLPLGATFTLIDGPAPPDEPLVYPDLVLYPDTVLYPEGT